jgi:hypothetical protein
MGYPESRAELCVAAFFANLASADRRLIEGSNGSGMKKFDGTLNKGEWYVEATEDDASVLYGSTVTFRRNGQVLILTHSVVHNENDDGWKGTPRTFDVYAASLNGKKIDLKSGEALPGDIQNLIDELYKGLNKKFLNDYADGQLAKNFNTPAAKLIRDARKHADNAMKSDSPQQAA